jgi:glyoxylase-like metal-dependent hydrolase (beta-lactamase superfamily II)
MPLATECKPAVLPLPGGQPGATVRVHPLQTGEMHAPPAWIDRPRGRLASLKIGGQMLGPRGGWDWLPIPAFLIEHPGVGAILIDTGLHPSCASDVSSNMGRLGGLIYQIRMDHDQALRIQLPEHGIQPTDIKVVIMTHLHIDHASAVSEFPQATFVVNKREWSAAAEGGVRDGYHARHFDHAFDWRSLDYDSDSVVSFSGFAQSLDLFGDGSVNVVSTPGHTFGHQSVVLRTTSREILVIGDAAYTVRGLRGESIPILAADRHLYERSLKEIRRYLDQTPDALAIPGHDPAFWPTLDDSYE